MIDEPLAPECAAVREALLTGRYERITRDQAERHLAEHDACRRWAETALLLTHVLSGEGEARAQPAGLDDGVLAAYLDGELPAADRRRVEDACCGDLKLAGRLRRLRDRRVQERLRSLRIEAASRLIEAAGPRADAGLVARLEDFRGLYLHRPQAVAAAQAQRSTFQTPDGRFVVSVVDLGAKAAQDPHVIEIGLRAHEPEWVGHWACYRVVDAAGVLAAAGVVKVEPRGNAVRVRVPPTEHAPYSVHVQMLEVETDRLEEVLRQITATGGGDER